MLYELFETIKNMSTETIKSLSTIEIMWYAGYWTMMFFVGTAQPNNIIDICFMFVYGFSYALMGIYTLDILAKIKHAFNIHFHKYLHSIKPILSFVTNLILFIPRLISQVFNNIEIAIKSIMQNKRKHVSQVEETIALVQKNINPRFDADACAKALKEILKNPTEWYSSSDNPLQYLYPLLQATSLPALAENSDVKALIEILLDVRVCALQNILEEWEKHHIKYDHYYLNQTDWEYISKISQLIDFPESVESQKVWKSGLDFLRNVLNKSLSDSHPNAMRLREKIDTLNNMNNRGWLGGGLFGIGRLINRNNNNYFAQNAHDPAMNARRKAGKDFLNAKVSTINMQDSFLDELTTITGEISKEDSKLKKYMEFLYSQEEKSWQNKHHIAGIKELIQSWRLTQTDDPVLTVPELLQVLTESATAYAGDKNPFSCHPGNEERIQLYVGTIAESNRRDDHNRPTEEIIKEYAQQYLKLLGSKSENPGTDAFYFSTDIVNFLTLCIGKEVASHTDSISEEDKASLQHKVYQSLLDAFPKLNQSWLFYAPFYSPQNPNGNGLQQAVEQIVDEKLNLYKHFDENQNVRYSGLDEIPSDIIHSEKDLEDLAQFKQQLLQYAKLQLTAGITLQDTIKNMFDAIAHYNGDDKEIEILHWLFSGENPVLKYDNLEFALSQYAKGIGLSDDTLIHLKAELESHILKSERNPMANSAEYKELAKKRVLAYLHKLSNTEMSFEEAKEDLYAIIQDKGNVLDAEYWLKSMGIMPSKKEMFEGIIRDTLNNNDINIDNQSLEALKQSITETCQNLITQTTMHELASRFNESQESIFKSHREIFKKVIASDDFLNRNYHVQSPLVKLPFTNPHEIDMTMILDHINEFVDPLDRNEYDEALISVYYSLLSIPNVLWKLMELSPPAIRNLVLTASWPQSDTLEIMRCILSTTNNVTTQLLPNQSSNSYHDMNTFFENFVKTWHTNTELYQKFSERLHEKNLEEILLYRNPFEYIHRSHYTLIEYALASEISLPKYIEALEKRLENHEKQTLDQPGKSDNIFYTKLFIMMAKGSYFLDGESLTELHLVESNFTPIRWALHSSNYTQLSCFFKLLTKAESVEKLVNSEFSIKGVGNHENIIAQLLRSNDETALQEIISKIREYKTTIGQEHTQKIINALSKISDRSKIQQVLLVLDPNKIAKAIHPEHMRYTTLLEEATAIIGKKEMSKSLCENYRQLAIVQIYGRDLSSSKKIAILNLLDRDTFEKYKEDIFDQLDKTSEVFNVAIQKLYEFNLVTIYDRLRIFGCMQPFNNSDIYLPFYPNHRTPPANAFNIDDKNLNQPKRQIPSNSLNPVEQVVEDGSLINMQHGNPQPPQQGLSV